RRRLVRRRAGSGPSADRSCGRHLRRPPGRRLRSRDRDRRDRRGGPACRGRSSHRRNRRRLRCSLTPGEKDAPPGTPSAGLSMSGRDDRVRILSQEFMGGGWAKLTRYVVEVRQTNGQRQEMVREVEDHGNSVAVLPFDPQRRTVLLVRQFRFAAYLNGHDGWLVEACAGMIDAGETAEQAVVREARE